MTIAAPTPTVPVTADSFQVPKAMTITRIGTPTSTILSTSHVHDCELVWWSKSDISYEDRDASPHHP